MALNTKDYMLMEKSMEEESLSGQIIALIQEILLIIILRVSVFMSGQTAEYLMESG